MRTVSCLAALSLLVSQGSAEVLSSNEAGFTLSHQASSSLAPEELWDRLMAPSTWWADDHTYSGDASNISDLGEAGSAWREDWETGSVVHGRVLLVKGGEELVLSAPFGPLLYTGAECIWAIKLSPGEDGGTLITSSHTVVGGEGTGIKDLAPAVDFVMGAGIASLAGEQ
ncbi:MAG: hypothetical protein AAFR65_03495 [Pseudomonadota bacterium]